MKRGLLSAFVVGCVLAQQRRRPPLSGVASKSANSEESLGSTLLSAVLSNDLVRQLQRAPIACACFQQAAEARGVASVVCGLRTYG